MKDNLGRSDVAFARNGFAEGAQNGQRVGMRSPVGAPDNWAVRDVLTKKRVQMGPNSINVFHHIDFLVPGLVRLSEQSALRLPQIAC